MDSLMDSHFPVAYVYFCNPWYPAVPPTPPTTKKADVDGVPVVEPTQTPPVTFSPCVSSSHSAPGAKRNAWKASAEYVYSVLLKMTEHALFNATFGCGSDIVSGFPRRRRIERTGPIVASCEESLKLGNTLDSAHNDMSTIRVRVLRIRLVSFFPSTKVRGDGAAEARRWLRQVHPGEWKGKTAKLSIWNCEDRPLLVGEER
jgi:hypothetical protein